MKLALQIGLCPGKSVTEKAKWARDRGVEGIELGIWGNTPKTLREQAEQVHPIVPVVSVCGNMNPEGGRGFDFLDPDAGKRRASIDGSKCVLEICGDFGASGQIVPPIFGGPVVPDLSPWKTALEIEEQLMLAACEELGAFAAERKTSFMLEPLNRYEQHYLRKQSDAVRVIKKIKDKKARRGVGLLSDFFHMHIEETSTPEAFKECGKYTTHVHLADNTRQEPGTGDIDFVPALAELARHKFKGYMAYECGISGAGNAKKHASALSKSLDYMRENIRKAQSAARD